MIIGEKGELPSTSYSITLANKLVQTIMGTIVCTAF